MTSHDHSEVVTIPRLFGRGAESRVPGSFSPSPYVGTDRTPIFNTSLAISIVFFYAWVTVASPCCH